MSYRIIKAFPVFNGLLTNLKVFHEKQIINSSTKQWKQIIMHVHRGKEALKNRTDSIYGRPVTDARKVFYPEGVPSQTKSWSNKSAPSRKFKNRPTI
jgi:hypothetical protein